jgi:hypothetical protein
VSQSSVDEEKTPEADDPKATIIAPENNKNNSHNSCWKINYQGINRSLYLRLTSQSCHINDSRRVERLCIEKGIGQDESAFSISVIHLQTKEDMP